MAFIVKTAADRVPGGWGTYRRVAVLEVEPGVTADDVAMISPRAKGVIRVVETWNRLNVGKTDRCAYRRALAAAHALAEDLNTNAKEVV